MFDAFLGNAGEINADRIQKDYADVLIPEEKVHAAFQVIRDTFIFTDKRLLLVDKQGITGQKVEYMSIPYKSIRYFSVETAGRFDRDAELKIWITSRSEPTVTRELKKGVDVISLQKTLMYFVSS